MKKNNSNINQQALICNIKLNLSILTLSIFGILFSSCRQINMNQSEVKIGINEWFGYYPLIIAEKTNIFAKNGISAQVNRYSSAKEEMDALRAGEIQGAALTLEEVLDMVSSGFPMKVVLALDYSKGGDLILGQPEITDIKQLAGKKIGYESSGIAEFLLFQGMAANGMSKSSVEMINVPANQFINAFKLKKVDALVCFNPIASKLMKEEKANELFSSAEIPFQIIDVLVFSEPFYNRNKDVMVKIVQSWFDAIEFQEKHEEQALKIVTQIKNIDSIDYVISREGLVAPDLSLNLSLFKPESEQNIYKYTQPIVNFMLGEGIISERINTADLFSRDILEAIKK